MSYEEKTKAQLIEIIDKLESKIEDLEDDYEELDRKNDRNEDEICDLEDEIENLKNGKNDSYESKISEAYYSSIGQKNTKILLENIKGTNIYLYVE